MKIRSIICAALAVMTMTSLCACGNNAGTDTADNAAESTAAAEVSTDPNTVLLTNGYDAVSDKFDISGGWSNGSMFNCTWRRENCVFEDTMKLIIDKDAAAKANEPIYSGGEFRSRDFYGYGYYETEMKPIKNDGVVSSFFTYTGPTDSNPWDEIDIEFLGKDTTKVQFNYFTDSKGNHEYLCDLGFDASEGFHKYGFKWEADKITWYVDGEAVYTADKDIPSTPGKIMMNAWPGTGVDSWLKAYDGNGPLTAEYRSVKFEAAE